jgi:acyl-CoA synthetase (NDP forming)
MSMWQEGAFDATMRPLAEASNIDAVLFHTSFGMGPSSRMNADRGRAARQAESLAQLQDEAGKPIVVAIRPSLTADTFEMAMEFQEMCWENGLATYPGIERAARALAGLLRWQGMRE